MPKTLDEFIGAEILKHSEEVVELKISARTELVLRSGYYHTGIIAYAAETAIFLSGTAAIGDKAFTLEFKINFLKPARGEFLLSRATIIDVSDKQAVCSCNVFCIEAGIETKCAIAQGTILHQEKI